MLFAFVPDPSLHWFLELCSLALMVSIFTSSLSPVLLISLPSLHVDCSSFCFPYTSLLTTFLFWGAEQGEPWWFLYLNSVRVPVHISVSVSLYRGFVLTCTKRMCFSGYITSDVKNYWVMRYWTNLSQLPTENIAEGNQQSFVFAMLLRKAQNPWSSESSVTMLQTA